jgi:predicted adenine nucleotide alpha hydrolase (AANH) superfamily ATPase
MNNVNYDAVLTDTINGLGGRLPKLLLHVCCAPCATYCLLRLAPYFDITLYYANDNIVNTAEWEKRRKEVLKLVSYTNSGMYSIKPAVPLKSAMAPYNHAKYHEATAGHASEQEGGRKCYLCMQQRLAKTFDYAVHHGFEYFATTLSVSPHKNSQWINEIGLALSEKMYLPTDFKKQDGFKRSVELSAEYGLYRQSFCGCKV